MSSALKRGRILDKDAANKAASQREQRLDALNRKTKSGTMLSLTRREVNEWRRLTGKMHP